jgi:hypothetical protein
MSFCLNYFKILCLAGFVLLGIFCLMIYLDVETLKVKSSNKDKGMLITGITSGVIEKKIYKFTF